MTCTHSFLCEMTSTWCHLNTSTGSTGQHSTGQCTGSAQRTRQTVKLPRDARLYSARCVVSEQPITSAGELAIRHAQPCRNVFTRHPQHWWAEAAADSGLTQSHQDIIDTSGVKDFEHVFVQRMVISCTLSRQLIHLITLTIVLRNWLAPILRRSYFIITIFKTCWHKVRWQIFFQIYGLIISDRNGEKLLKSANRNQRYFKNKRDTVVAQFFWDTRGITWSSFNRYRNFWHTISW